MGTRHTQQYYQNNTDVRGTIQQLEDDHKKTTGELQQAATGIDNATETTTRLQGSTTEGQHLLDRLQRELDDIERANQ